MPAYAYICQVCSTRVESGFDHCLTCGCPAETSGRVLNLYRARWTKSEKSEPITDIRNPHFPLCFFTSLANLIVLAWLVYVTSSRSGDGNIGYWLIALVILAPLSITGVVNSISILKNRTGHSKFRIIVSLCLVFSLIVAIGTLSPLLTLLIQLPFSI